MRFQWLTLSTSAVEFNYPVGKLDSASAARVLVKPGPFPFTPPGRFLLFRFHPPWRPLSPLSGLLIWLP